jgi:hypothetical protein
VRLLYFIGSLYVGLSTFILVRESRAPILLAHPETIATVDFSGPAGAWFQLMKPYCNSVEVETRHRWMPPPSTPSGAGYSAACFALAGNVEKAREIIQQLPGDEQWRAAGIVFNTAHPVADAGDDRSAGPIMEMVIEFWPNHYQALYHAGMSRYALGDRDAAREHLRQFLDYYNQEDGFTANANAVLDRLGGR